MALDFVWDNPGESVPEETFTHSHLSWSSIIPYLLPPSITIHGILPIQFTCQPVFFHFLGVFFGLPLSQAPPLHTPYIFSPNFWLLFAAHAHTIATCFAVVPRLSSNPSLTPNPLVGNQPCSLMPHIHLTTHLADRGPLKCHLIFLSYGPGLTSVQQTTSHTTAVQSPSHYQWYILIVSSGTGSSGLSRTKSREP